ncbi:tyrosine-protein phosphatase [Speluncibacter jeojiensis]|uniref:Tyrosine-protein phosphatase n=1 Tax=Speluncibacter jeojiensis TaxID=2710754 RepID=A0A9X4RF87_9ACTN|nr:tyrosine-protein phosphatase [Corynebacteriales bacterium D3-21]
MARTGAQSVKVDGLDPIDRWYFEVRRGTGHGAVASTRQFMLQGAHNARDIGGYATSNGRMVRWGKVFRSDSLSKLTADDDRALADASVKTVVDYRGDGEIAKDGADKLPATAELVHIPVLDDNTQALATALVTALQEGDPSALQSLLGDGKAAQLGDEGFVKQLQQPQTMAGYGKTMQLIADNDGALIYHCTSGKDRTGMMTALLLGILGVPNQTIVDDFVLSNTFNHEHNEQTYAYLRSKGIDVDLIKPLMEQRPSEIQPVLDAVEKAYGGWDSFAEHVLNLSPETLAKLRHKLLV